MERTSSVQPKPRPYELLLRAYRIRARMCGLTGDAAGIDAATCLGSVDLLNALGGELGMVKSNKPV